MDETGLGSGQMVGSDIHCAEPSTSVTIQLMTKMDLKKIGCEVGS